jgi:hypothetical protein
MTSYFNKLIEVCDSCFRACCWYGEFMCDNAKAAGTTLKTVSELRRLNLENKDYWSSDTLKDIYGDSAPHGYRKTKD